jgi:hypothetical protein
MPRQIQQSCPDARRKLRARAGVFVAFRLFRCKTVGVATPVASERPGPLHADIHRSSLAPM